MLTSIRMLTALCLLIVSNAFSGCGDDASPMDAATPPMDATPPADADRPDADMPDGSMPADAGTDAPMADSWANFAQGFFADYCVGCHSGGTRDYRTITEVLRDSSTIACGVSPATRAGCGSFPPPGQFPVGTGAHPSDVERLRLVAWIDAGLPE